MQYIEFDCEGVRERLGIEFECCPKCHRIPGPSKLKRYFPIQENGIANFSLRVSALICCSIADEMTLERWKLLVPERKYVEFISTLKSKSNSISRSKPKLNIDWDGFKADLIASQRK